MVYVCLNSNITDFVPQKNNRIVVLESLAAACCNHRETKTIGQPQLPDWLDDCQRVPTDLFSAKVRQM